MLVLKLLPLLLATVLPTGRAQPAKCEKKEFAETQAKYQQCAAAKIASISKALEVREVLRSSISALWPKLSTTSCDTAGRSFYHNKN